MMHVENDCEVHDLQRLRRVSLCVAIVEVVAVLVLAPDVWLLGSVHILVTIAFAAALLQMKAPAFRDIHYAAIGGFAVTGPVGAVTIALCTFALATRSASARGVKQSDFAEMLVRDIRLGTVRQLEGPTPAAFGKLMLRGSPEQQLALLQVFARDFHADYAQILHAALRADALSVRASAAALATSLKKRTASDVESALAQIETDRTSDIDQRTIQTLIECIESGFLLGRQLDRARDAAATLSNGNISTAQKCRLMAAAGCETALVETSRRLPHDADQSARRHLASGLMRIGRHDQLRMLLKEGPLTLTNPQGST